MLEVPKIVLKVLSPIRVEQPQLGHVELFLDIIEGKPLVGYPHFVRFAVGAVGLVDEDLAREMLTTRSSGFFSVYY